MEITGIIKEKIRVLYKTKENFSEKCKISLETIDKAVSGDFDNLCFSDVKEICTALNITLDFCIEQSGTQELLAVLPSLDNQGTQRVYTSIISGQKESEKQSRQS